MGVLHCPYPVASVPTYKPDLGPVNITFSKGEHVIVHDFLRAPAYKGIPPIGHFHWLCGKEAFLFLLPKWSGCCYFVNITISNLALLPMSMTQPPEHNHIHKREMAQFANLHSYHLSISLGEKLVSSLGTVSHFWLTT